jgi:pyrimidine-nucleoside phosphorylase
VLAGHLLALGEKARDPEAGRAMAQQVIENGKAWECFRRLVQAQGGDLNAIDFPESLLQPAIIETILAPQTGFLVEINALTIGEAAMRLGAGREKKEQPIDHAVGVVLHHKVGDLVVGGQPLFTLYANQPDKLAEARQSIQNAHRWSENLVEPLPLFYDVIDGL